MTSTDNRRVDAIAANMADGELLFQQHRDELRASALSDATIAAHRFRTLTDSAAIARILRWPSADFAAKLGQCLEIPFFSADGQLTAFSRLKPSCPRQVQKSSGEMGTVKYEQPRGQASRCYFPLGAVEAIRSVETIGVTEGEKKSLSLTEFGVPTIGLTGIWNWQRKRENKKEPRQLIDDLNVIEWSGRRVHISIDGDAKRNASVVLAACSLADALAPRGAWPEVIRLQPIMIR